MSTIPQNYVLYRGQWCHPSRVPTDALLEYARKGNQSAPKPSAIGPTAHFDGSGGIKTPKVPKPRLNKRETIWKGVLAARGITEIYEQAITLRMDPPYKSYRPDLAYHAHYGLVFVEVKGPHRFREKGIAKAALAAKTYPEFRFELADWDGKQWKETVL